MSLLIIRPTDAVDAYIEAASIFQRYYEKVTGKHIPISDADDGESELIVIGSDSVNDFLMREILDLHVQSPGIRYGTDDYCIRTYKKEDRHVLILAGGRGRSTLYAVYDYFERYANCHYYWDGDVLPHSDRLPMSGIDVCESPRFYYRGLRYFAHRGLKRFQAEHWSFEDWQREIDWLVKKGLNFFMLRIGMDDVWQRAFPDDVPYPDSYRTVEGVDAEGYNDRSDFWTLKYRGELRMQVLAYARKLDLMYPTDCGTMTHWYSRTPEAFLATKKPVFLNQDCMQYIASDTGKVFDFTRKENMDYYMHLTETMVDHYDKSTALFHTIGLGERRVYEDKTKNFALKRIAYRRIAESIRQRYPESKLMLASWDFCGFWSTDEVAQLFAELDPERTVLLDYTSDMNDPDHSFLKWNVVGRFPWIFGIFHAYEAESELRGPYDRIDERLRIAAEDPNCQGMILWPELSHSDPLMLEYLAHNAWSPLEKSVEAIIEEYCNGRYGAYAHRMNHCWQGILPFIKLGEWGGEGHARPYEDKGPEMCPAWYMHTDLWTKLCMFMGSQDSKRTDLREFFQVKEVKSRAMSSQIVNVMRQLAEDPQALEDSFILRDSIDIARTVIGRFLNYTFIRALNAIGDTNRVCALKRQYFELLEIMSDLLHLNSDFSIYQSLKELEQVAPTNPDFEITLKRNICNGYCAQPASELVDHVFKAEAEVVFQWLIDAKVGDEWDFGEQYRAIMDDFWHTPLDLMQTDHRFEPATVLSNAATCIAALLEGSY